MNYLENIYISPLETCNLNCKYCYTKKTKTTLSSSQIFDFISRYKNYLNKVSLACPSDRRVKGRSGEAERDLDLKSITFCGGEVFLLLWFTALINTLLDQKIFITIITNGTIDKLSEIKDPQNCQLIVSFDGPKEIHDQNRGEGNFNKSVDFVKKAISLGFPVEIFFLVTKDSYSYKDSFDILGLPKTYLTDRLHSLTPAQILDIKKNYPSYPNKNFGCFQLALQSDGQIYGCCEAPTSFAQISDPIEKIIDNFKTSLTNCFSCSVSTCHGCCSPDFLCHYKKELSLSSCQEVVKSFI